jgi:hypothetical protein
LLARRIHGDLDPETGFGRVMVQDPLCARAAATILALTAEVERVKEALTPSGATKAEYIDEFYWIEDMEYDGVIAGRKVFVPWTTIKDIMAAIRARAAIGKAET